ncbi:protein ALP1-like [Ischnura elegans]|uniref:protein ALP1-like n=1 Tax=Ischnura elegans TaxID=197161 RepID=UPI001ED8A47F|nr:protein ALP1-like [Ischnura elegans]
MESSAILALLWSHNLEIFSANLSRYQLFVTRRRREHRQRLFAIMKEFTQSLSTIDRRVLILHSLDRKRRGKNKQRSGHWWEVVVSQHFDESDWLSNFRMSKCTFEHLCLILEPKLCATNDSAQTPVPLKKKVAMTIYKLASCAEFRVVANQFGVAKSTACKWFRLVVVAINTSLMEESINLPSSEDSQLLAALFKEKFYLPQVIGAIDGTHIPILPPKDSYRDFINRKGWPSVNLTAVVDYFYCFRYVSCKMPGSVHDARALKESTLYQFSDYLMPSGEDDLDGTAIPYLVLGDPAYPLLSWLLKGYPGRNLSPEQESFNVYLSSARMCVEIAFGRLKARWRCLLKRIDVDYTFVPQVVTACCILHNLVERSKDTFVDNWLELVQEHIFPQPSTLMMTDRDNETMASLRNKLCSYLSDRAPLRQSSM